MNEQIAQRILRAAIEQNRAGELLDALFNGGTATVELTGELVIIPAETLAAFL